MSFKIAAPLAMLLCAVSIAKAAGPSSDPDVERLEAARGPKLSMSLTMMNDSDLLVSVAELTTSDRIPKAARALYAKALKADEKGEEQKAIDQLQAAIELAPEYFQAHAALAVGYMKIAQIDEAVPEIEIALKLNPNYLPGREIQAILWFMQGNVGGCAAAFAILAKQSPNRVLVHHYLGLALLKLGRPDEANRHLHQADELLQNPPHPPNIDSDFDPWNPFPAYSRPWGSCDAFNQWRYPVSGVTCGRR